MKKQFSSFSDRLRFALHNAQISSTALALLLDVSPATISGWLSGKKQPKVDNLVKLSQALNISLCWLVHERGHINLFGPLHITHTEEKLILQLRGFAPEILDNLFTYIASMTGHDSAEALIETSMAWHLISSANVAILILDREFIIRDINEAYLDLLNVSDDLKDKILNTSFLNWLAPNYQAETLLNTVRSKSSGTIHNFYTQHILFKKSHRVPVILNIAYHVKGDKEHFVVYAFSLPEEMGLKPI